MSRSHGVIKVEVWEAVSDFRRLYLDAQWAYAMLVSQPLINNLGVLPYVPEKWARLSLDLTPQRLRHALDQLEEQRYTVTDEATAELLIRTFIRHDKVWSQPKLVTNARRLIREVESPPIRDYLLSEHPWLTDETWSGEKIRRHENRRRPRDTPSETPSDTPSETPIAEPVENGLRKGVTEGVSPTRARVRDGLPQPLDQDQPLGRTSSDTSAAAPRDNAAAANLIERLDELGLNGEALTLAQADPPRAEAWLALAATEARTNPAMFILGGLRSGEWPTPRGPMKRHSTAAPCPECGTGGGDHTADCPTLTARLERVHTAALVEGELPDPHEKKGAD